MVGNFYSREVADGTMDPAIEIILSKIESRAAPVYESLLLGQLPIDSSQPKMDFAHFLASMYVRTTAMRRMATEVYGRRMQIELYATARNPKAFDASLKRYKQETGEDFDEEDRADLRRTMTEGLSDYQFTIPQDRAFAVLGAADQIAPILNDMKWSVMTANDGFFITCDNPVMHAVDPTTVSPAYGDGGFLNETVEVTFPLSPFKLLYLSSKTSARLTSIRPPYLTLVNKARAAASERYLFAHTQSTIIAELSKNFRDIRPSMTTSGFGPRKFGPIVGQRRTK